MIFVRMMRKTFSSAWLIFKEKVDFMQNTSFSVKDFFMGNVSVNKENNDDRNHGQDIYDIRCPS